MAPGCQQLWQILNNPTIHDYQMESSKSIEGLRCWKYIYRRYGVSELPSAEDVSEDFVDWQGGSEEVPWDLLEQDGNEQAYALVEQKRLPIAVDCLWAPWKWSEAEGAAWWDHISQGEADNLHSSNMFQFLQARPGEYNSTLRSTAHPEASLFYPPESLRYYESSQRPVDSDRTEYREDELPYYRAGETYLPLSDTQLSSWESLLQLDESCRDMVELLFEFEALGPPQVR